MKIKNSVVPAGTIINHNGTLYEIGAYYANRNIYEVHDTANNKGCELTTKDIKGDYIENEVTNRVTVITYPTSYDVHIDLFDANGIRYAKTIDTDALEAENIGDCAEYADIDCEVITEELEEDFAHYPLTEEEKEYLHSKIQSYYTIYKL